MNPTNKSVLAVTHTASGSLANEHVRLLPPFSPYRAFTRGCLVGTDASALTLLLAMLVLTASVAASAQAPYSPTSNLPNNIMGYGADPAGHADASIALAAAILATPNGGTVIVPCGDFLLKRSASIGKQITIAGFGQCSTLLVTGIIGLNITSAVGSSGVVLRDLRFHDPVGSASTIFVYDMGVGTRLQNVTLQGANNGKGVGVEIDTAYSAEYANCWIGFLENGIKAVRGASTDQKIDGTYLINNTIAINSTSADGAEFFVEHSTLDGNGTNISLGKNSSATVSHSYLENDGTSIAVSGGTISSFGNKYYSGVSAITLTGSGGSLFASGDLTNAIYVNNSDSTSQCFVFAAATNTYSIRGTGPCVGIEPRGVKYYHFAANYDVGLNGYALNLDGHLSATGVVTSAKGIGPTDSQSLLWTSGRGAPSGNCTNGSMYTSVTGTTSNILWVCGGSTWRLVK